MPLLLLTHHVIPWAFKKARQLVRSGLGQPQAQSCPPNTETDFVANRFTDRRSLNYTTGSECLSETQQNTAEQYTSVISRNNLLNNTCSTHVDTPCDESCEQFHRGSDGSRLSIVPKALVCIPRAAVLITRPIINFTKATVTTFLNMAVDGLSKIRGMLRNLFPLPTEVLHCCIQVAFEIAPTEAELIVLIFFFTGICFVCFRFCRNCLSRLKEIVSQDLSWVHMKTSGSECPSETQQNTAEQRMVFFARTDLLNNTCSAHVDTPSDEFCEQCYRGSEDDTFLDLD